MIRLYLSIIFSVICALFLLGWGLDEIAGHSGLGEDPSQSGLYRQLVDGLVQQVGQGRADELPALVRQLGKDYGVVLSLDELSNYALAPSLLTQLSQPGGLLLASESGAYLYRTIPAFPELLLQLQLPERETRALDIAMSLALYAGLCGALVLWLLPLTRSLYQLNQAAAQIGEGQFHVRITPRRFSYLEAIEANFNHMAAQIEKLMMDNRILARSLSHDIRTPMACLRFGLDVALEARDPEKCRTYLQRMDTELSRMEDMTTAFLDYAGMERQGQQLQPAQQDFAPLVQAAVAESRLLAEQQGITLKVQLPVSPLLYSFDFHWCYRALQNLISNALSYAASEVQVSLVSGGDRICLTVEDDGKGIPREQLDQVFDPFVKLEPDRSREKGHYGLGLAIVARVMEWHHGQVRADASDRLGGARFELLFSLR